MYYTSVPHRRMAFGMVFHLKPLTLVLAERAVITARITNIHFWAPVMV